MKSNTTPPPAQADPPETDRPGPQPHNRRCPATLADALRLAKRPRKPAAPPATRRQLLKLKRELLAELRKVGRQLDAAQRGKR